jgi:hypothetical protein
LGTSLGALLLEESWRIDAVGNCSDPRDGARSRVQTTKFVELEDDRGEKIALNVDATKLVHDAHDDDGIACLHEHLRGKEPIVALAVQLPLREAVQVGSPLHNDEWAALHETAKVMLTAQSEAQAAEHDHAMSTEITRF